MTTLEFEDAVLEVSDSADRAGNQRSDQSGGLPVAVVLGDLFDELPGHGVVVGEPVEQVCEVLAVLSEEIFIGHPAKVAAVRS